MRARSATVRPLRAALWENGQPDVLLLHGQPGSASDWQWVVPRLEERYTLVIPDRPGYGRTGGPSTDFVGNAEAVVELLDRLGIDQVVAVAHSWAGGAALALAAHHPSRVSGLVLVSSIGPGERWHWDDKVLAAPVLGELISALSIGGMGMAVSSPRVRDLVDRYVGKRAHDAMVTLARLTRDHAPVWRSFVAEQRVAMTRLDALDPSLATITVPTVVLHGRSDRLVEPAVAERLQASIPGSQLRIIPAVGHLIPHDRPDAIAAAVDDVVALI